MCAIVLAPSLVGIIALAVASMSGGRNSNWMKYQQMEPPYTLQCVLPQSTMSTSGQAANPS